MATLRCSGARSPQIFTCVLSFAPEAASASGPGCRARLPAIRLPAWPACHNEPASWRPPRVCMPLSATTTRSAGMSGRNSRIRCGFILNVTRSRLLTPMICAPAATAHCASAALCTSTRQCICRLRARLVNGVTGFHRGWRRLTGWHPRPTRAPRRPGTRRR